MYIECSHGCKELAMYTTSAKHVNRLTLLHCISNIDGGNKDHEKLHSSQGSGAQFVITTSRCKVD